MFYLSLYTVTCRWHVLSFDHVTCYMLHVETVSYSRFNDTLLYFHMEHWSLLKPPFVVVHIIWGWWHWVFGLEVYQWFLLGGSRWLIPPRCWCLQRLGLVIDLRQGLFTPVILVDLPYLLHLYIIYITGVISHLGFAGWATNYEYRLVISMIYNWYQAITAAYIFRILWIPPPCWDLPNKIQKKTHIFVNGPAFSWTDVNLSLTNPGWLIGWYLQWKPFTIDKGV